jgi:hypothetical protein
MVALSLTHSTLSALSFFFQCGVHGAALRSLDHTIAQLARLITLAYTLTRSLVHILKYMHVR